MLAINILWTAEFVYLFYGYHFTGILWLFMYPDWVLFLSIAIGLIGMYISYKLIRYKISLKNALLIDIPILIIGFLVAYIVPM